MTNLKDGTSDFGKKDKEDGGFQMLKQVQHDTGLRMTKISGLVVCFCFGQKFFEIGNAGFIAGVCA